MTHVRRMQPWLGTFVEVGVEAGRAAERATRGAFEAVAEVHRLLSFQDGASDLSRLNDSQGRPVELHPISVAVLRLARAVMRASGGHFNCTVGGMLERLGALPAPRGIAALERGDPEDIVIIGRHSACLRRPVHITLDGIAKGFAVDRAVMALQRYGAGSGWVNAGGDLRVFGESPAPLVLREDGRYRLVGRVSNRAIATSAASSEPRASFPARIVSPTGAAVSSGSWTVLAREAWRADALTKVAALLPETRRGAAIERLGGRLIGAGALPQ